MLLAVHTALNGYMTVMMMMKITGTKHLTIYHKTTIRSTYDSELRHDKIYLWNNVSK